MNTCIPEVLATFAEAFLDQEWQGQRESHLSFEEMHEDAGLKGIGERRDQTGCCARTYKAAAHVYLPFFANSYEACFLQGKRYSSGSK